MCDDREFRMSLGMPPSEDADNVTSIKCVVIGDEAVGKTSILLTYAQDKFPTTHEPTVFDIVRALWC